MWTDTWVRRHDRDGAALSPAARRPVFRGAGGTATLTVRLSGAATTQEAEVFVSENTDLYTLDAAGKTIPAGGTSVTFAITAVDDADAPVHTGNREAEIFVQVSGGFDDNVVAPDPGFVTLTIRDNEPVPEVTLSVSPNPINEGNLGKGRRP